ncbi:tRNA-binding protein Pbp11 [Pyrococcus sp. ST04]|uniref:tRNA-binding protein Pbp11 n=1 Tax=Pyrococcus sp. ST04 TaxID=1183377 RepID=UPI0002605E09|nr:tRNA-binding protein Pbp11 [Pyrococcus sp. ST04]AFK22547.1 putative Translation factor [Pyrococcus sp. ST04]
MGIFEFFKRKKEGKNEKITIVSKKPVAVVKFQKKMKILGREVIIGTVESGIIKVGYKIKGKGTGIIMEIEKNREKVEFAIPGDEVALMLEGSLGSVKEGELLEVYVA